MNHREFDQTKESNVPLVILTGEHGPSQAYCATNEMIKLCVFSRPEISQYLAFMFT